jgi:hypothetical protein
MTSEDMQQGWRLAAVGTLGLTLLIGGLGALVAFAPEPRRMWLPDASHRRMPAHFPVSMKELGSEPNAEGPDSAETDTAESKPKREAPKVGPIIKATPVIE